MKLRYLYLASAFLGFVLPYSQFVPWIAEHHALNMSIFLRDLCDCFRHPADLIHPNGRETFWNAAALVANDRHVARGRFIWPAALSLSSRTPIRNGLE